MAVGSNGDSGSDRESENVGTAQDGSCAKTLLTRCAPHFVAALMSVGGIDAAASQLAKAVGCDLPETKYLWVAALVFVVPAEYRMIRDHSKGKSGCGGHSHDYNDSAHKCSGHSHSHSHSTHKCSAHSHNHNHNHRAHGGDGENCSKAAAVPLLHTAEHGVEEGTFALKYLGAVVDHKFFNFLTASARAGLDVFGVLQLCGHPKLPLAIVVGCVVPFRVRAVHGIYSGHNLAGAHHHHDHDYVNNSDRGWFSIFAAVVAGSSHGLESYFAFDQVLTVFGLGEGPAKLAISAIFALFLGIKSGIVERNHITKHPFRDFCAKPPLQVYALLSSFLYITSPKLIDPEQRRRFFVDFFSLKMNLNFFSSQSDGI